MIHYTIYDEKNKIWRGLKQPLIFNPNITVGSAMLNMLEKSPNKVTQINADTGIKITCKEMKDKSIRATLHLIEMGINANHVVGIIAKNDHNIAPITIAALTIGAAINPLDPSFTQDDIAHMWGLTKPRIVFCDNEVLNNVEQAIKLINLDIEIVTMNEGTGRHKFVEEFFEKIDGADTFIPQLLDDGCKQPAIILCTSGTTGLSKGAMLSHVQALSQLADILPLNSQDIHLCFSSIFWASGAGSLVCGTLMGCTRVITREKYSPQLMLELIEKYRVSGVFTAPYQMALLLQSPNIRSAVLNSIRFFFCSGGAVSLHHENEMNKVIPNGQVNLAYGLSEAAGLVAFNKNLGKTGSSGQLSTNCELKIIDESGQLLGPEEDGEIVFRFSFPFLGYCGNPEATSMSFDEDGWFYTGDIGHMDLDGYLYLVDRKKDIMKYMGNQISPSEIEAFIAKTFDIAGVCVVGISDKIKGTDLPAAVIVRPDDKKFTEEDVYNVVAETMADFKKLRGGVYFIKSFPFTASGKIQRRIVLELATKSYREKTCSKNV